MLVWKNFNLNWCLVIPGQCPIIFLLNRKNLLRRKLNSVILRTIVKRNKKDVRRKIITEKQQHYNHIWNLVKNIRGKRNRDPKERIPHHDKLITDSIEIGNLGRYLTTGVSAK